MSLATAAVRRQWNSTAAEETAAVWKYGCTIGSVFLPKVLSVSRAYVSDDNPFSESHFRTLKYRPDFPVRFGYIQDSRPSVEALRHASSRRHCGSRLRNGRESSHTAHSVENSDGLEGARARRNQAFGSGQTDPNLHDIAVTFEWKNYPGGVSYTARCEIATVNDGRDA